MHDILFITDSDGFGGAEIAMLSAASALAQKPGVRVSIGLPPGSARLRKELDRLSDTPIRVLEADGPLSARSLGQITGAFRRSAALRAARVIRESGAGTLIVNLWNLWSGAAILDAAKSEPLVRITAGYLQLGHRPSRVGARFGNLRDRLLPAHLRRFDVLLAVSETQRASLRGLAPENRCAVVYQPVAAVCRPRGDRSGSRSKLGLGDVPLIGVPGRIVFGHKGQDVAARTARRLLDRGIVAHWVIMGDGPDAIRLRRMVADLRLEEHFHFVGWRDDVEELLPAFDAVALPSRYEGMPLTAVEAISAGVPVVAFAVDGLAELVPPPFAVPPFDEAGFADALQLALDEPQRWPRDTQAALVAKLCKPSVVAERIIAAVTAR